LLRLVLVMLQLLVLLLLLLVLVHDHRLRHKTAHWARRKSVLAAAAATAIHVSTTCAETRGAERGEWTRTWNAHEEQTSETHSHAVMHWGHRCCGWQQKFTQSSCDSSHNSKQQYLASWLERRRELRSKPAVSKCDQRQGTKRTGHFKRFALRLAIRASLDFHAELDRLTCETRFRWALINDNTRPSVSVRYVFE
jgi:hypothetical protein